ncbi:M3 family metallopeptidase [Alkalihalobacillus pseudalcaliphilus]|uniref:M3 family metallopeptidase n=1 Tax=Alkalihalobacillus pseudalcaliphilus TaxID=79884 RepID=UPI00069FBD4F|nr:M3 family metallopeptidase [Alkalihalobacillus pseudalcaliphilus]
MKKTRQEVSVEETWDLTPIFASEQAWEQAYDQVEQQLDQLLHIKPQAKSAQDLFRLLQQYDHMMVDYSKVSNYAFYRHTEDATDESNQNRIGRSHALAKKSTQLSSELVNHLLATPSELIETYIEQEPQLQIYSRYLEKIEQTRKHALDARSEELLSALRQTLQAPNGNYLTVTSSDLVFKSVKNKDEKEIPVSLFTYLTQIETSPDTVLRRNAYRSLTEGLSKYQHGMAQTLNSEIQKNVTIAKLRGYESTMDYLLQYHSPAESHFYAGDGVSTEYFEQVLDTFLQKLSPHMQRYASLRKQQLGLDELLLSDVKAPLDPDFDPMISYEEAGEIIVEAVAVLGPEYQALMKRVFTERWVYRADNVGRRMIAFGGGVHGVHGYSFYPWVGNLFDLLLLGHELGHAIHLTLAADNQKFINNSHSLLFIESPSTLVEHLIVQYLEKNRTDPRLLRWLNMYQMMSYHHNCVTHILEAELLRRLYKMADQKKPLSTNVINETKGAVLAEFWGDTVDLDEGAKLTWMRQPHYYMGLYPFTYSVGISASTVIANRIKAEGVSVGEQWTEVLKLGGTLNGLDLYKQAGMDMSSMAVIEQAIDHVGHIVTTLEKSFY